MQQLTSRSRCSLLALLWVADGHHHVATGLGDRQAGLVPKTGIGACTTAQGLLHNCLQPLPHARCMHDQAQDDAQDGHLKPEQWCESAKRAVSHGQPVTIAVRPCMGAASPCLGSTAFAAPFTVSATALAAFDATSVIAVCGSGDNGTW